jgi:hypothetical protein
MLGHWGVQVLQEASLQSTLANPFTVDPDRNLKKAVHSWVRTLKDAWHLRRQMSQLSVQTKLDSFFKPALSLTHGAGPFLRSCQLCSYSRTSQHLMEPEGSLPCSQEPSTSPYPEPDQSNQYSKIHIIHTSNIPSTKSHIHFLSLTSLIQGIRPGPRLLVYFRNKFIFLRWGIVIPTPNPQAGGPPLFGSPRLLIQYILSHPPYLEGVFSIRNLRTPHAVVTRDPPNMETCIITFKIKYNFWVFHQWIIVLFFILFK